MNPIFLSQVLYCATPKCGSTTWIKSLARSILGRNASNEEVKDARFRLQRLQTFSNEEIDRRLKTYFKFLVVRHPFERLLSAYRDEFEGPDGVHRSFVKYVPYIKKEGKGANNNVTFPNFVNFLYNLYSFITTFFTKIFQDDTKYYSIDLLNRLFLKLNEIRILPKGQEYLDGHFAQYATLCHPCHVDYDYIVKLETMREDAAYVLSKLGPHDQCLEDKYPDLFSFTQTSSSLFNSYFSTLSSQQIHRLKKIYSIDFKLFGYEEYRSNTN